MHTLHFLPLLYLGGGHSRPKGFNLTNSSARDSSCLGGSSKYTHALPLSLFLAHATKRCSFMLFLCFFFACYGVASRGHFSAPAATSTPVSACQTVFRGSGSKKKRTHTRAELRIRAPRESRFDGAVALLLPQRRRRKIFFLFALATLLADLRLLDWIFQKRSIAVGTHAHSPPPVWGTTRKYQKNYCLSLTVQGKSFSSRKRV